MQLHKVLARSWQRRPCKRHSFSSNNLLNIILFNPIKFSSASTDAQGGCGAAMRYTAALPLYISAGEVVLYRVDVHLQAGAAAAGEGAGGGAGSGSSSGTRPPPFFVLRRYSAFRALYEQVGGGWMSTFLFMPALIPCCCGVALAQRPCARVHACTHACTHARNAAHA